MAGFTDIIGNERNIKHLWEASLRGRLSHAYIVNGPKGSGKRTFADYIAAGLQCDKPGPMLKPCGTCPACAKSMTHNHPDIIHVSHEKPKLLAIDEIRDQVIASVPIAPYYDRKKIFIIPDAHLLNDNGQNALLKTIEEPPEYVMVLLLTENSGSFLDTITSRCVKLDMEELPDETVARVLETKYRVPETEAEGCAAFAHGNLGMAIEMSADKGAGRMKHVITDILSGIDKMDALEIFERSTEFTRENADYALDAIKKWYRDVLIIKAGGKKAGFRLYYKNEEDFISRWADNLSYEKINRDMADIDEAYSRLESSVKTEAVFESLFLRIRRND